MRGNSEHFHHRVIERLRRTVSETPPQANSTPAATSSRRLDRYPQAMVATVREAARRRSRAAGDHRLQSPP